MPMILVFRIIRILHWIIMETIVETAGPEVSHVLFLYFKLCAYIVLLNLVVFV